MRYSKTLIYILLILIFISCSSVPITGRKQLTLISDNQILSMSSESYTEFKKTHKISTDAKNSQMVKDVGLKIQKSVEQYFAQNNMSKNLEGYNWEFNLIEEDTVNAWCMPGGKVVVYTGILPLTKDETGLAVVMGHEIAHAVANHGNERMSQGMVAQYGGVALNEVLKAKAPGTKDIFMQSYGVTTQVGVLLPYSRKHETEADHLGLIFMAMAGYNPNEAIAFWQRMSQLSSKKAPEFLSTHPSDDKRIEDIKKALPEAMKYYKKDK